jgi:hypothetical protein
MSKIIVPLHFAKLTTTPNNVEIGFKKFYLKGEWFKLYNGASEIDVVLDRPLDNYVPKIGTITSSDTVLTAIEKLDYAIGNINPNVLWGSITGNILAQTDLIAYIAALPASPLSALPFTTDHLTATNNQYVIGDLVWYLGNVYRCIANNDSIIPTSTLYWTSLGTGYPLVQQPADWNSTSGNNQILNKPTIPTTPSLQQVTTAGAITTDAITVAGIYSGNLYSDGYNFGISDNYDTNYNLLYQPFVGLDITNTSDHVYIYQDASIGFQNFAGGYGNLRSDLVTGSWSWQLPDASGTLALTSNIGTWGALNYPTWTTGTPFVKMTAAGTFALDTTSYYPYPTGTISQYIRGDGTLATFPSATIPTLQQVTTAGNTTTDAIFLQTGVSPLSAILSHSYISLINTLTGKSVTISTNNDVTFSDSGGNFLYLKSPATILGTNTQTLQNASGTIALLSDIPAGGVTSVTATSPITSSGGTTPVISTSMATNKLIGRSTAGTGVMEEITIGTGLTLSGGTLSSSGGIPHGIAAGTDTYTVTIAGITAYAEGDAYIIRFTNGNTTSCTLNINGIGAVSLYRNNDGVLIGGDIIDNGDMLCVYDTSLPGFRVIGTAPNTLLGYVTNDDSVTITKGQVVYAFGGQGDRMTVKLANNTGDATSARTVGLVVSTSIGVNQKGLIMMQGLLDGLNILPTATWSDGDPVYLGATPGSITKIKPYAPAHLVYVGTVTTASNGSAGRMYVNIQNGYELDELHNVQAQSPSLNDTLWYDNTVTPAQWKTASIPAILGYTPPNLGLVQAMTQGLQNIF